MATFAVLMKQPRPAVVEALKLHYPEHIEFSPTVWFLRTSEGARQISDKLFAATDVKSGVTAVRLSADYFGYAKTEIWDWVGRAFKEDARG